MQDLFRSRSPGSTDIDEGVPPPLREMELTGGIGSYLGRRKASPATMVSIDTERTGERPL